MDRLQVRPSCWGISGDNIAFWCYKTLFMGGYFPIVIVATPIFFPGIQNHQDAFSSPVIRPDMSRCSTARSRINFIWRCNTETAYRGLP